MDEWTTQKRFRMVENELTQEGLSVISKHMLIKYPFYGYFTLGLKKYFTKSVKTAGVCLNGINCELAISPKFWNKLTKNEKVAVMIHEIMHIAHNHVITHRDYKDKKLFNIAADVYINQFIDNLPDLALFPETYDLPRGLSTKEYYKMLEKKAKDRSNSNLNKTLDALEEGKELICSHKWDDFDKLDEQTAELVKKQVEHQAKNIADICKSQGFNLPSELKNWLDDLFKVNPPTLNWKKALSRFVHGSIETFRKRTKKKRNKRYPDAKGSKTKFKPRGIVYLDGSGSVHKSEYEMFYSELQYLKDVINFDIAHFDYHVATPYKYKGENKLPKSGGGTSFKAVSEHFNKNSKDYSFGIILTDGEAEDPGRFMKPMLWLVTTEHGMSCIENYHGIKIKMKKN